MAAKIWLTLDNNSPYRDREILAMVRGAVRALFGSANPWKRSGRVLHLTVAGRSAARRITYRYWPGKLERYQDGFAEMTMTLREPGQGFAISIPRKPPASLQADFCTAIRNGLRQCAGIKRNQLSVAQSLPYGPGLPGWSRDLVQHKARPKKSALELAGVAVARAEKRVDHAIGQVNRAIGQVKSWTKRHSAACDRLMKARNHYSKLRGWLE